ncbi:RNA polymerase sigma-70 factor [Chitinophaga defluvii]|uniref:RNA polymerase sigma factor n=1 Tax=Chitinophaga defluvii TaxID=3163343 RepID=A0ABV2TEB2_9BACT
MMHQGDEKGTLVLLQQGNVAAFREIYARYYSALYNYALGMVKIPALAEDVVQDVFLKIWEVRARINPSLSFTAYLYRIARNNIFKRWKKIAVDQQLRDQVMLQLSANANSGSAELQVQWKAYQELLNKAVDNLPPQRKRVYQLCREDGRTYEETANELGISKHTVKEHMTLATRYIREYFYRHAGISLALLAAILETPDHL